jgi:hypothetical protein
MRTSQEHVLLVKGLLPLSTGHAVHTVQWLPPNAGEDPDGESVEGRTRQHSLPQEQGKFLVILRIS